MKNTQISTNTLVVLIFNPQTQIYNISLKNESSLKIAVFKKII